MVFRDSLWLVDISNEEQLFVNGGDRCEASGSVSWIKKCRLTFGCTGCLARQKFSLQGPAMACGDSILYKQYSMSWWKDDNIVYRPETTIASLGPQVWNPQVMLLLLVMSLGCCLAPLW